MTLPDSHFRQLLGDRARGEVLQTELTGLFICRSSRNGHDHGSRSRGGVVASEGSFQTPVFSAKNRLTSPLIWDRAARANRIVTILDNRDQNNEDVGIVDEIVPSTRRA